MSTADLIQLPSDQLVTLWTITDDDSLADMIQAECAHRLADGDLQALIF